jgi:hypothetical protein
VNKHAHRGYSKGNVDRLKTVIHKLFTVRKIIGREDILNAKYPPLKPTNYDDL